MQQKNNKAQQFSLNIINYDRACFSSNQNKQLLNNSKKEYLSKYNKEYLSNYNKEYLSSYDREYNSFDKEYLKGQDKMQKNQNNFNEQIKENSCPNIWDRQSNQKMIISNNQKTKNQLKPIQLRILSESVSDIQEEIIEKFDYQYKQVKKQTNKKDSFYNNKCETFQIKINSIQGSQKSKFKFDLNQFSQIKSRTSENKSKLESNQSKNKNKYRQSQNIQAKFGYQIGSSGYQIGSSGYQIGSSGYQIGSCGYQIGSSVQSQEKTFSKLNINSKIQKQQQNKNSKSSIKKISIGQNSQIVSEFNESIKSKLSEERVFSKYKQSKKSINDFNSNIKNEKQKHYKNISNQQQEDNQNDLIKLISSRPIEFQSELESSQIRDNLFNIIEISEQLRQFVRIIQKILKKNNKNNKLQEYGFQQILFQNQNILVQIIHFCKTNNICFMHHAIQYLNNFIKQNQLNCQTHFASQKNNNIEFHWSLLQQFDQKKYIPRYCTLNQLIVFKSLFEVELLSNRYIITESKNTTNRQFARQMQTIMSQKQLNNVVSFLIKQHENKKCQRCPNQIFLKPNNSNNLKINKKQLSRNTLSTLRQHLDEKTYLQYRINIWKIFQCLKQDFFNLNQHLIFMEEQIIPIQNKFIDFIKENNASSQFFIKTLKQLVRQSINNCQKNKKLQNQNCQIQLPQIKTIRNYKPNQALEINKKKQTLFQVKTFRLNYQKHINGTHNIIKGEEKLNEFIQSSLDMLLSYNQFCQIFKVCNTLTKNQILQIYKYLSCITDKKTYKITDTNKLISLKALQKYTQRCFQFEKQSQTSQKNILDKNIKQKTRQVCQLSHLWLTKQQKRGINIGRLLKKQKDYILYIEQLQQNRQKLLQIIHLKDKEITKLKKENLLNQIQFENQAKILQQTKKWQKQQLKRYYEQKIGRLSESNRFQQQQVSFYRQQLQNLTNEINQQHNLSNRYANSKLKYQKVKQMSLRNDLKTNQNVNLVKTKIDDIFRKINQQNSILQFNDSDKENCNQSNIQFQEQFN